MVCIWPEEVRRNKLEMAELDESARPETARISSAECIDLEAALPPWVPHMRLCLVLVHNDGLSYQEISDIANIARDGTE
jgi:DNA-directed RNA polymerase specialized sigma24 family protein